jgi:hypothetical protein
MSPVSTFRAADTAPTLHHYNTASQLLTPRWTRSVVTLALLVFQLLTSVVSNALQRFVGTEVTTAMFRYTSVSDSVYIAQSRTSVVKVNETTQSIRNHYDLSCNYETKICIKLEWNNIIKMLSLYCRLQNYYVKQTCAVHSNIFTPDVVAKWLTFLLRIW